MVNGPILLVILVAAILFIIVATARFKIHPFIALLLASYGVGFAAGLNPLKISGLICNGFGGILSGIGIVIILGTIIGVFLEKSGAAVTMADTVLKVVGPRRPGIAMSIIGYIVSIPVFCDSGFVILSSLRRSLVKRSKVSSVMMSVALATGLYAAHTLIPPTPGPIAAAGNLGLKDKLGLVIIAGLILAAVAALAGFFWARLAGQKLKSGEDTESVSLEEEVVPEHYAHLPGPVRSFAPIVVPIVLIALASIANFPGHPFGDGLGLKIMTFTGAPVNALLAGFFCALPLMPEFSRKTMTGWIDEGLKGAAIIIMITGAGGAFGTVLKATPIGAYLGETLAQWNLGVFLPFIIAAALKTAQGSSTVSLVTTSVLIAPLLTTLGLDSTIGRVLTVMAVGAGAMTISHANDSFFWVVAEFSGMEVTTAYKALSVATLIMGLVTIGLVAVMAAVML
ncbi:GntP family permease [Lentisphaerota bacterium ZTH]|nr:GntP family permease [Lentisphaerota bacterium]WET05412.1 GntP family permease [Lentisphaerota bacterium ZTH]